MTGNSSARVNEFVVESLAAPVVVVCCCESENCSLAGAAV